MIKTIQDIEIRNCWSEGKDLVFTYNEGDKRKKARLTNYNWYVSLKVSDVLDNKDFINENLLLTSETKKFGNYYQFYFDGTGGKVNDRATAFMNACKMKGIKLYEADVHSAKRYMTDYPIKVSDKYDILYWDIETDDTTRIIKIGKERILSIGCIDNKGKEFYFTGEEQTLIKDFLNLTKNYDVITGWNTHGFDLPYLKGYNEEIIDSEGNTQSVYRPGRMDIYRLKYDWKKIASIDMLERARKVFKEDASLKSYTLENICQYFLGKGKVKFEGKIIDLYNSNPEKLKEYNLQDVKLLKELDEKTGMIDLIAKECALGKALIRDFKGIYVSEILDCMILRDAHSKSIVCPSKTSKTSDKYEGGMVFEPQRGFFKDVYVFDFTSLYPSIILTSNIGFDTIAYLDKEVIPLNLNLLNNPGTGIGFLKNPQSIIAQVVERLITERKEYKKKRLDLVAEGKMKSTEYEMARANEIIIKELSNSVYGIMGLQGGRYYQLDIARSITMFGQWLITFAKNCFSNLGYSVIYGDTDSIFVHDIKHEGIDVEKALKKFHTDLELELKKFNIDKSWINLKYEKKFENIIMVEKKYYVGNVSNIEGKTVNEFIAKGLDIVKRKTIPIALEAQTEIINAMLNERSKEEIGSIIQKYEKRMFNDNFKFDDLKISVKLNKELKNYKQQNAPHVRIAKELIKEKGYLETSEIEYVVVNSKNTPQSKICHSGTFDGQFDRSYYYNDQILPGIIRVAQAVYPDGNWDKYYASTSKKVAANQLSLF